MGSYKSCRMCGDTFYAEDDKYTICPWCLAIRKEHPNRRYKPEPATPITDWNDVRRRVNEINEAHDKKVEAEKLRHIFGNNGPKLRKAHTGYRKRRAD